MTSLGSITEDYVTPVTSLAHIYIYTYICCICIIYNGKNNTQWIRTGNVMFVHHAIAGTTEGATGRREYIHLYIYVYTFKYGTTTIGYVYVCLYVYVCRMCYPSRRFRPSVAAPAWCPPFEKVIISGQFLYRSRGALRELNSRARVWCVCILYIYYMYRKVHAAGTDLRLIRYTGVPC